MAAYEPNIVAFLCNWCSYEAADASGRARIERSGNVKFVRVMCTGRIEPQFILRAYEAGADGVLVLGCHPGDCHYKEGNHHALRRHLLLKKLLVQFGIEDQRLRLDWVSASEGEKFAGIVREMTDAVRELGPLCAGQET